VKRSGISALVCVDNSEGSYYLGLLWGFKKLGVFGI